MFLFRCQKQIPKNKIIFANPFNKIMFPIDLYMFLNLEVYEVSCLLIWGRCWSNLVGRLQFFPRVGFIFEKHIPWLDRRIHMKLADLKV